MNPTYYRELAAQGAIVLAVSIGGWMMFVKPKIDELAKLDQTIAEHAMVSASAINQQSVQKAAQSMSTIKQRLVKIADSNSLAGDSSKLYGLVMDLADAHRVQVQSLQPGVVSVSADNSSVSTTRLNITIEGSYENIAGFLDAVCSLNAFIRPQSLHVSPVRDATRPVVEASFGCDVLDFAVEQSLAELGGLAHAQP